MSDGNSNLRITVTIRAASKPGSVKAHADVRVEFSSSSLRTFWCFDCATRFGKARLGELSATGGKRREEVFSNRENNRSAKRQDLCGCLARVGANVRAGAGE